jgi:branched-chain amino acid aminotransferase
VVRLVQGKLLFLDDHLERLQHSLNSTGILFPGRQKILDNLRVLLEHNSFTEGNIRICVTGSDRDKPGLRCYFIPYSYPGQHVYMNGILLVTYSFQRSDPGIKRWDNNFRVSVNEYIRARGVYEAVLVNENNEITEGSRSNIFFIDGTGLLVTPPSAKVLPGITRKHVLAICGKAGMEVEERPVRTGDLPGYVSCFISGTSPKVLPVRLLDEFTFRVDHPLTRVIMEAYDTLAAENLTDLRHHPS